MEEIEKSKSKSKTGSISGKVEPFHVSTDFDLGLFLRTEKSTIKKVPTSSRKQKKHHGRFKHVDDYVTFEYWSLDLEYLLSCIVPLLWSLFGLFLINWLLPGPCFEHNRIILTGACYLFLLNTSEQLLSLIALMCAKYSENWHIKIGVLNTVIGVKLILTTVNFMAAAACFVSNSCGFWFSVQLREDIDPNGEGTAPAVKWASAETEELGMAIINGFRYYDVKIVGMDMVFASIGQCVAGMILLVKRNDIKMYVLWRLAKLDTYIDEMHSHQA